MTQDDLLTEHLDAKLPPSERTCPMTVGKLFRRAQHSLGQPINQYLVRCLITAKCHQSVLEYTRHVRCPTCLRRTPPPHKPRACMPHRPTRFKHAVGLELSSVRGMPGVQHTFLNILDFATMYSMIVLCGSTTCCWRSQPTQGNMDCVGRYTRDK